MHDGIRRFSGMLAVAAVFLASSAPSLHAVQENAPSLSVHESSYGTRTSGNAKECIQGIDLKLISHHESENSFQVQCFFMKRGLHGAPPSIDDTVIFDVNQPHGTYTVSAKPIKLPGPTATTATSPAPTAKTAKTAKGKSSKTTAQPKLATTQSAINAQFPREGYVVRVLSHGVTLREYCSNHTLEKFLKDDPALFEKAAASKSARHLVPEDLLKR
jgi:hypothetical protein